MSSTSWGHERTDHVQRWSSSAQPDPTCALGQPCGQKNKKTHTHKKHTQPRTHQAAANITQTRQHTHHGSCTLKACAAVHLMQPLHIVCSALRATSTATYTHTPHRAQRHRPHLIRCDCTTARSVKRGTSCCSPCVAYTKTGVAGGWVAPEGERGGQEARWQHLCQEAE